MGRRPTDEESTTSPDRREQIYFTKLDTTKASRGNLRPCLWGSSGRPPERGAERLCSTITGFDFAPGAEQRHRQSPEAELLVIKAQRFCELCS